jgi:hypothetical protein
MPQKQNDPLFIATAVFARMAGLGPRLVRHLIADGELPVKRIHGRVWLVRADAMAWLQAQRSGKVKASK